MGEIVECNFDEITSNPVSVIAFVPDLMDQSKLRLKMPDICFVKEVSELIDQDVDLVVVDLSRPEVLEVLPEIDSKTLGFASHIDKEIISAAEQAGCEKVSPRSKFFRDFNSLVNSALKLN
jgi:hypothetical protein